MKNYYDAKKDICNIANRYEKNKKERFCKECESCFIVCRHSKDINF